MPFSTGTLGVLGAVGAQFWAETKCDIQGFTMEHDDGDTQLEPPTMSLHIPFGPKPQADGAIGYKYAKMSFLLNPADAVYISCEDGSTRYNWQRDYSAILLEALDMCDELAPAAKRLVELGALAIGGDDRGSCNVEYWVDKCVVDKMQFADLYTELEAAITAGRPRRTYELHYKVTSTERPVPSGYHVRAINTLPLPNGTRVPDEQQFHTHTRVVHPGSDTQAEFNYWRTQFIDRHPDTRFSDGDRFWPVTDEHVRTVTETVRLAANAAVDAQLRPL